MLIEKQLSKQNLLSNLKDTDVENADGTQTMFVLKSLEKIKETGLKLYQENVTILLKMKNYEEARIKLSMKKQELNLQIHK